MGQDPKLYCLVHAYTLYLWHKSTFESSNLAWPDWALKRQMMHSMSRGVDWMVLVSDDSDFSEMLGKAREANLGTVVVGDQDRSLGRHVDIWVPWIKVENGEIKESGLELKSKILREFDKRRSGSFSVSEFDGGLTEENWDVLVGRMELDDVTISSFSEVEEGYDEDDDWIGARLDLQNNGNSIIDDDVDEDYLLDSEDKELEESSDAYI